MKALLAAALAVVSLNASAEITGKDLLELCSAPQNSREWGQCTGYIIGVADLGDHALFCIPPGKITYRQLGAIGLKTIVDIPAVQDKPAYEILTASWASAFPCPPAKGKPAI
jgi:hypothetical protein